MEEAASKISEEGRNIGCPVDLRRQVHEMVNKHLKPMGYEMVKVRADMEYLLCSDASNIPVIAELVGTNTFPHCIGFLGCWIIDPSEEWALERTHKNLNGLCKDELRKLEWAMAISKAGTNRKQRESKSGKRRKR
jgi:hypothetical protein